MRGSLNAELLYAYGLRPTHKLNLEMYQRKFRYYEPDQTIFPFVFKIAVSRRGIEKVVDNRREWGEDILKYFMARRREGVRSAKEIANVRG